MRSYKKEGLENMKDPTNPFLDDAYELWWILLYTQRIVGRARSKELTKYKITPEEAAVLWAIKAAGPDAKLVTISQWLMRQPHSISGLVSRMEKGGLIKKCHDLGRQNWVRVELTEKGEKAYAGSLKRESIQGIVSALSKKEQKQMRLSLIKMWKAGTKKLGTTPEIPYPHLLDTEE
jgi:MarR family transcriptional regulator, transcriptional regulator for hemolysin